MGIEFNARQRKTLTAIVDTFVAAVPRDDDPTGFYATKGSDVGADVALEQYLSPTCRRATRRPAPTARHRRPGRDEESTPGRPRGDRRQPRRHHARDGGRGGRAASAFGDVRLRPARRAGPNPLWDGMGYPGPGPGPAGHAEDTCRSSPRPADETLEADVVVVGSGSGGGVAAAVLAQAGKRVIILEAGGYRNESDFVQLELVAYQNLFLRGGFFPSADGMITHRGGRHRGRRQHRQLVQLVAAPRPRCAPAGRSRPDRRRHPGVRRAPGGGVRPDQLQRQGGHPERTPPAVGRRPRPSSATRIASPTSTSTRTDTTRT